MEISAISIVLLSLIISPIVLRIWERVKRFVLIRRSLRKDWKGPDGHWFWGHLIHVDGKGQGLMTYLLKQVPNYPYGHRVDFGPFYSFLRVSHPDIAKQILSCSDEIFPKDEAHYHSVLPWLGYGLLILSGKEWFRRRRLLTSSFHFDILQPYADIMNNSVKELIKKWEMKTSGGKEYCLEIFGDSSLLTLDSTLKCLMSFNSDCQAENPKSEHRAYVSSILRLGELAIGNFRSMNPFYLHKITSTGREFSKACEKVHEYSESVIRKRKQEIIADSIGSGSRRKHLDFLDMLLKAQDEEGNKLTDEEIRAEVDTFMFEGHDTTASAIAWSLYLMAKHKEHQTKCHIEIVDVVGDKPVVDLQDLTKMTYLTMCVKESLRLYPPVPGLGRKASRDMNFDGRTVKKGTPILLSVVGIHRNPTVWPDPDEFIPTRFSPENSEGRSPYAYIPFSAGPRNCIGQNFAMNEIKIFLAQILRHFEISVDGRRKIVECTKVTYATVDGLYLNVKKREGIE